MTSSTATKSCAVRATELAEMDDAVLEAVVLADDEVLRHAVEPDDVGTRMRDDVVHQSSCAKLPCRRVNTRWAMKRRTTPMTPAISIRRPSSGG